MRNLISGMIGIAFGGFVLLGSVLRGGPQGEGAYRVGQYLGLAMGVLFLVGGVFYLVKGIKEVHPPPPPRRRRKRRVRHADDDEA